MVYLSMHEKSHGQRSDGIDSHNRTWKRGDSPMRNDIHPDYKQTTITCACGHVWQTASTQENIRVEICSKCHPFFTGRQKLVDTGGRVDRFKKKFGL